MRLPAQKAFELPGIRVRKQKGSHALAHSDGHLPRPQALTQQALQQQSKGIGAAGSPVPQASLVSVRHVPRAASARSRPRTGTLPNISPRAPSVRSCARLLAWQCCACSWCQ